MKVAVFLPNLLPHSVKICVQNILGELRSFGVDVTQFSEKNSLPSKVDLFWDPRACGGAAPYWKLFSVGKPVVVTVHGAAPFALPASEYYTSSYCAFRGQFKKTKFLFQWLAFRRRISAIITVSHYAKSELNKFLRLQEDLIIPVYHGVDHNLFKPDGVRAIVKPYILHVSSFQPKKNVNRVINAYRKLDMSDKPRLIAVVPNFITSNSEKDIDIITTPLSHRDLVKLYQGASLFVFPSLHETFGMPIIEAMACGCPVITSAGSACAEVSGSAAMLVDPRLIDQISQAMKTILTQPNMHEELRRKGLKHALDFSWQKSAEKHHRIFQEVLKRA